MLDDEEEKEEYEKFKQQYLADEPTKKV